MSAGGAPRLPLSGRLGVRLAALMTVVLLPLGIVSILQTSEITETLQESARVSLLAQTEQTALGERTRVLSALGAAYALGAVLPELSSDPEDCRRYLAQFVETAEEYVNAIWLPKSGPVSCRASGQQIDAADVPRLADQIANPHVMITSRFRGVVSQRPVVVVRVPVVREDAVVGVVVLSMDYASFVMTPDGETVDQPLASFLFNGDGEIVSSRAYGPGEPPRLPGSLELRELAQLGTQVFVDRMEDGAERTFAVVPLIPGTASVMTIWPTPKAGLSAGAVELTPIAFPLAMWAASLIVGYLATHRLVVRHVRKLGSEMRTFARSRHYDPESRDSEMSEELQQIRAEFLRMAEMVLRDEAALENALREKNDLLAQKNVLMKEVHHRVKNNLQLISSIMNMQIRKSRSLETKAIVQRLQERVLGLATVHRNLYQAGELGAINAGQLVREISEQMLAVGGREDLRSTISVDNIILYPDQAVPLSLLTAEAVTNALKYGRAERGRKSWISVTLERVDEHAAVLTVENSLQRSSAVTGDGTSDGLGTQLIRAFSAQLDSEARIVTGSESFSVSVTFPIEDFRPVEAGSPAEPEMA